MAILINSGPKKTMREHKKEWFDENAPFAKELGYPDCCIQEFCDQPPALLAKTDRTENDMIRYEAGCINGVFSGLIPCVRHAKEIIAGKITLASLIKNRNSKFHEFPNL